MAGKTINCYVKELKHLNKYFLKYKYHLILGVVFTALSNIFQIIPAQLVRHAIDLVEDNLKIYQSLQGLNFQSVFNSFIDSSIMLYGVLILIFAIIRGLFLFLVRQTIIVMSRLIEFDLKNEIYFHYQTLPLSFYRRNNTGDLIARISEDVSKTRMYIGPAVMYGINMIILFAILIPIMFSINVRLTTYALLPLPILSLSIYFVNNIINKRSEAIQKKLAELSTFVQEAFSGIRVIKSFAREEDSIRNFTKESESYKDYSLKLTKVNALFFPVIMFLIGLSTILTIYVGGIEVIKGNITLGNIAEFVLYVNLLTWPVTSLGWVISITQTAEASQKRINEFLHEKNDIVSSENSISEIKGKIEFRNVDFTYKDSGINALRNISFKVEEGESIAVIGTTGSGKSTIANLITRMFDTTGGSLLIDGKNIKEYDPSYLRSQIGYVPQDVFLFSDTIANNIAFGSEYLEFEKIKQAAIDADLYSNIKNFPDGFNTVLGERGITLSGGQKQRLSIARAIVREPGILILDDCLSAVDTSTENTILKSLKDIMSGRTTVIISHRVSSAKLADKIIVIDDGMIIEEGTNESLMEKGGVYRDLYEKQLQAEEKVS